MEPITVNYKVLDARAKVPAYATPGSAAADRFLETGAKDIGLRDSYDISKLFR